MAPGSVTMFDHLDTFSDRTCLIGQDGTSVSYGQLLEKADAVTQALAGSKKLVFIDGHNSVATIAAYVGAWRGGHAIHLVDPKRHEENARLSALYQPNATIRCEGDLAEVVDQQAPPLALHPDLAVLLSTSGSTGTSKFVKLSAANVIANTDAIISYLGLTGADRAITSLKPFYSYGFSVINTHLRAGASLVLSDISVQQPGFWDAVRQHEVSNIPGVPHTFEVIASEGIDLSDLPALRFLTQAGGKLGPALVTRFAEMGARQGYDFFVMYGQTEAAPRISYLPPDMAARHPGAIGKAVPGGQLELRDGEGQPILEPDVEGELVYSGPNVMIGYATTRDELGTAEEIGQLFTGDLARRNQDGLFEITGRKARMVKPFGLRISLDEIEAILSAEAGQAAAIGLEDTVVVVLESGATLDADQTQAFLSEKTGLPRSCFLVQAGQTIPRLSNGKIDYKTLQGQDWSGLAPTGSFSEFLSDTWREFRAILTGRSLRPDSVLQAYQSVFPRSRVEVDMSFRSLGGDSLALLQMQLLLEEYLGQLPDGWEIMTIQDLETLSPQGTM